MMNRFFILFLCAIMRMIASANAQATITLSIDSADNISPIVMNDTTDFIVRVRVDNSGSPDSIAGDIFYYYQTDSMVSVAAPPRVFEQDFVVELVYDNFFDTIQIDIQPGEIRTGPMNLIVIWPAMINPAVLDTDSITFYIQVEGFAELPPGWNHPKGNIIFPCPSLQYIYIRPDEIDLIEQITISNLYGELKTCIPKYEVSQGWINIESLNAGNYIALCLYKNGTTTIMRFIKQ